MCPADQETDSLIDPAVGDPASADQCLIQFHQPANALYPGDDPMDESDDALTFSVYSDPIGFSFNHTAGRHSGTG